jgi:hypothetical protein
MSTEHEITQETQKPIRILGLPLQFVTVLIITVSLVIFFGGWAAQNSVENRQGQFNSSITMETGGIAVANAEADKTWWEDAALFVCPAH